MVVRLIKYFLCLETGPDNIDPAMHSGLCIEVLIVEE
jgi:hypothetical protein